MSVRAPWLVSALLVASVARFAAAGQVEIEYEITSVGTASPMDGTMTLVFSAVNIDSLTAGPGSFATFSLSGTILTSGGLFAAGAFFLPSPLGATGYGSGTLQATSPGLLSAQSVFCAPFPNCSTQTVMTSVLGAAEVGGDGAFFTPMATMTLVVEWTGTEVGRTFVPEARRDWLLPSGMALVAVLGRRRLRPKRSIA